MLAQLSPALNALVNGSMREASEARVEWPDLEQDTFVRFARYAYSRDYTEAEPEVLPEEEEVEGSGGDNDDDNSGNENQEEEEEQEEGDGSSDESDESEGFPSLSSTDDDDDDDELALLQRKDIPPLGNLPYSLDGYRKSWDEYLQALRKHRRRHYYEHHHQRRSTILQPLHNQQEREFSRKRRRVDDFVRMPPCIYSKDPNNLKYDSILAFADVKLPAPPLTAPSSSSVFSYQWSPRPNCGPRESYERVFLSHARLYILADKYGVEGLRALTLHRLHRTLLHFTIFPERIPDLVTLVETIYDNTLDEDPARTVLARFFGCVVEHVRECEAFRALLRRAGEFSDDLIREMANRLE